MPPMPGFRIGENGILDLGILLGIAIRVLAARTDGWMNVMHEKSLCEDRAKE